MQSAKKGTENQDVHLPPVDVSFKKKKAAGEEDQGKYTRCFFKKGGGKH